jgi:transposase InsO family protein
MQIDFIGPLQTHEGDYACTTVDVHCGIMLAKAHKRSDAMATIYTRWCWWARYGPLAIIESDQGMHFTSQIVKKWAQEIDVIVNYHLAYNPQAAGNIERHNGLLKLKLQYLRDLPWSRALETACYELNSRLRLGRSSPFETAFPRPFFNLGVVTQGNNLTGDCVLRII